MTDIFLQPREPEAEPVLELATVSEISGTRLKLIFDGQSSASPKAYSRLGSYSSPVVGQRVLVARISGSIVVLGRIT